MTLSPAKAAEPVVKGQFWGGKVAAHCKVWALFAVSCAKTAEPVEVLVGFGLGWARGPCIIWGSRFRLVKGQFWGEKWPAEDMPARTSGWYTQSKSAWASTSTVHMLIGCTGWGSHWHHLANTTDIAIFVLKRDVKLQLTGKYDWTVCVRQRCNLMSNYFDHL